MTGRAGRAVAAVAEVGEGRSWDRMRSRRVCEVEAIAREGVSSLTDPIFEARRAC